MAKANAEQEALPAGIIPIGIAMAGDNESNDDKGQPKKDKTALDLLNESEFEGSAFGDYGELVVWVIGGGPGRPLPKAPEGRWTFSKESTEEVRQAIVARTERTEVRPVQDPKTGDYRMERITQVTPEGQATALVKIRSRSWEGDFFRAPKDMDTPEGFIKEGEMMPCTPYFIDHLPGQGLLLTGAAEYLSTLDAVVGRSDERQKKFRGGSGGAAVPGHESTATEEGTGAVNA